MKILLKFFLIFSISLDAYMYHHSGSYQWAEENIAPFNELILSWNATRPQQESFQFYIRVKTEDWSPWLLYSSWGNEGQSSFSNSAQDIKIYQDTLDILNGKKGTAFKIKVEGPIQQLHSLHVYVNSDKNHQENTSLESVAVEVQGISQMALDHPRNKDLCSPTSTTAVIQFLQKAPIDPLNFAQNVWDSGFDIYGNWVFNVAEAAAILGNNWSCWVERLNGFNAIHHQLKKGFPVVVSVRGPLTGSALPYLKGHLLVVTGYDALHQKVLCMDPAFSTPSETNVSYELSDFIEAWNRRGNVAYIFDKKN